MWYEGGLDQFMDCSCTISSQQSQVEGLKSQNHCLRSPQDAHRLAYQIGRIWVPWTVLTFEMICQSFPRNPLLPHIHAYRCVIYIYIYVYAHVYMHVYVSIYLSLSLYIYIYIHPNHYHPLFRQAFRRGRRGWAARSRRRPSCRIGIYIYIYIYMYVHTYRCTCMYTYIYIYIYIYI